MLRLLPLILLLALPLPAQRRYGGGPAPGGSRGVNPIDVLVKFEGTLRAINKKELELDLEGDQTLTFRRTRKTAFYKGKDTGQAIKEPKIAEGTPLMIEAHKDQWGGLEVVNIFIPPPAPAPSQRPPS